MSGTILIVEGEPDLSATLEYALPREGFTTRTAGDGCTALGMLAESPVPDLVLLDMSLPDISGIEVCRLLRADDRTRSLPIVMTSARAEDVARAAAFEAGVDDFVVKPFSLRELAQRCRAVLRHRAVPQPAERVWMLCPVGRGRAADPREQGA